MKSLSIKTTLISGFFITQTASAVIRTSTATSCTGLGAVAGYSISRLEDFSHCINWGSNEPCEPTVKQTVSDQGQPLTLAVAVVENRTPGLGLRQGCRFDHAWIEKISIKPDGTSNTTSLEGLFSCESSENLCLE